LKLSNLAQNKKRNRWIKFSWNTPGLRSESKAETEAVANSLGNYLIQIPAHEE